MKMSKYDVDFQNMGAHQAILGPQHCRDWLNVLIKSLKSGIDYEEEAMFLKKNHLREGGARFSLVSQEDVTELEDMFQWYEAILKLLDGLNARVRAIEKKGIEIKWE
tara:strand:- start:214 stop:534 length:321 start_codon:yes stop_codon:yes gene_type:complete